MSIYQKIIPAVTLILALLLAACGGAGTSSVPKKQVSIESLGWIIENRDPSLSSSSTSARLRTYINLVDMGLEASDFASVEITDPSDDDGHWFFDTLDEFGDNFDREYSTFTFTLVDSSRDNGSVMPLGDYVVTLKLKNGNSATQTLSVPAPGSREADGYSFVYTEDYSGAGNPPSNYAALPKRATITNATLDAQASTLDVSFSVTDDMIYSGWLWFYDEAGEFVGYTDYLRNYETGAVMAQLNGGASLLTDGATNTLNLTAASEQLTLVNEASFSDIASVSVVLTDGKQYADTKSSYDTRSRTGKFNVAVIQ